LSTPATPYRIEALTKAHCREGFSSGNASLDRYLLQQARQDAEKFVAAAFVLVEPPSSQVLGYYTLSACAINVDQVPPDLAKRLPRYPQLPVTLLGRLARDERVRGKGAGDFLLMDALSRALQAAETIASMAVVVDAKDARAEAFYQAFGFSVVQNQPRHLFLAMSVITKLFK
jgi:predicted GNAT family N-acyltransferase